MNNRTPDCKLYLSSNKQYLTSGDGANLYSRIDDNGKVYYRIIGIESEAFEKLCKNIVTVSVCTTPNTARKDEQWEDVDICTGWDLVQKGFSNIS